MKSILIALLFLVPSFANAGLIGKDVTFQCPECGPPFTQTFTAEAGSSELAPFNQFTVDVEDDFLRVVWLISSSSIINPGHFIFSWDPLDFSISSAVLDIASTIPYNFEFSASSVSIDISGVPVSVGDFVQINLPRTQVSEPSSLALLSLSLLALGYLRRRRAV